MLDTYKVVSRVKEIRKRVRLLEKRFKPLLEEELTKDEVLNSSAEHNLQVAIQACLDIANHIVASLGFSREFDKNSEVFYELAQEDILPGDFADKMISMTGYRNVLVHGYLNVKKGITYDNIQNRLPDLAQFAQYIEKFLEKYEKNKTRK
ncbi:MAG: hypothetical protein ACD_57C00150G0004 [uncultured bacterium]|nr:MAG: hypothetical protein ACD_57C00150G0004 [uncultured bacterium]